LLLAKEHMDVVVTVPTIRRVKGKNHGAAGLSAPVTRKRYHCHCIMEDDSEVYLAIKATDVTEASKRAHLGYRVQYVLDVLTPHQMERRKRKLQPSLLASKTLR
jgi:hypothetical protein